MNWTKPHPFRRWPKVSASDFSKFPHKSGHSSLGALLLEFGVKLFGVLVLLSLPIHGFANLTETSVGVGTRSPIFKISHLSHAFPNSSAMRDQASY